jgi:hypothetical protein
MIIDEMRLIVLEMIRRMNKEAGEEDYAETCLLGNFLNTILEVDITNWPLSARRFFSGMYGEVTGDGEIEQYTMDYDVFSLHDHLWHYIMGLAGEDTSWHHPEDRGNSVLSLEELLAGKESEGKEITPTHQEEMEEIFGTLKKDEI